MAIDYGTLHSIATVSALVAFLTICWWAWRPANRQRFEQDGMMPLINDPIWTRQNRDATAEKVETTQAVEHDK